MIIYLHYILITSGLSGASVLLGVFLKSYSDATQSEIGIVLMSFPFTSLLIKPLFCSMADRHQAHKAFLIGSLLVMLVGYSAFAVVPFFPLFYENHPRMAYYTLVASCEVGSAGLGVAWSLGDSLAMNMSQKTKVPFSRYRLMGTVSWGVYGYVIGQINEVPFLPKFVPAFLILCVSVLIEIVLLIFWNNEDFEMYDPSRELESKPHPAKAACEDTEAAGGPGSACAVERREWQALGVVESTATSLGGTLRLHSRTGSLMRQLVTAEDLCKRLRSIIHENNNPGNPNNSTSNAGNNANQDGDELSLAPTVAQGCDDLGSKPAGGEPTATATTTTTAGPTGAQQADANNNNSSTSAGNDNTTNNSNIKELVKSDLEKQLQQLAAIGLQPEPMGHAELGAPEGEQGKRSNSQIVMLKLIMANDGRLIKYFILLTICGLLYSPMSFMFLSLEDVCLAKGFNFSQLAGSVLISQATTETICFLVLPWFLRRCSRWLMISAGLIMIFARYFFYSNLYYLPEVHPYWALVGEWGHGIPYGIFCTISAEVALMFSGLTKAFIPELRAMRLLSDTKGKTPMEIENEERYVKLALRATMQAIFGGFMDGLGQGMGCLICGIFADAYGFVHLWQIFYIVTACTLACFLIIEWSKCPFSDLHKPRKGTKAYALRALEASNKLADDKDKTLQLAH